MRITSNMYYKNVIGNNNNKLSQELFDVNKQIASGLKIQYAYDDVRTFTETMRLDNEIVTLQQITKSTQSGYKFSNQSDVTLSEFETSMNRTRVLLIKAANGTNDDISLDAISQELRTIEKNFMNLANTSINGQYLFSGSAVDTKPIDENGNYMGNDSELRSFTGSKIYQQYNISGAELFLGEDNTNNRTITSNVAQTSNVGAALDNTTTMADYNGVIPAANQHNFYLRGAKSDGTSFKAQIQLDNTDTIATLMDRIGTAYGNTGAIDVVNVSMNDNGQIVIEDKLNGSSKLDFHMVGASDFSAVDHADINNAVYGGSAGDIDVLETIGAGSTDYATALVSPTQLYVREYNASSLTSATGAASAIEGIVYDRANFSKDGAILSSSFSQVLKTYNTSTNPVTELDKNSFATPSTKISDVADLSSGTPDSLDGTTFNVSGNTIGGAAFTATIDLASAGSTFTVSGNTYDIFDMGNPRAAVDADEMTYQQLMDVMNMITTGSLPTPTPAGTSLQYDTAIATADSSASIYLTNDGKIEFKELGQTNTSANIALYDSNSDSFAVVPAVSTASVMTFNTNNALTIRDPKTDFFKNLNEVISAVENYKIYPDSSSGDARNVGIQNAIFMIDDLQDHVFRSHSKIGAQSNALETSLERTSTLEISTMTLRSEVIDTDLAEASLTLTQLQLNYQAMLSTVGKISQLSLVNYL